MKQTIVFDFDGVLVDSVALKGSAFSKVLGIDNPTVVKEIAKHHIANQSMGREEKLSTYMAKYSNHTRQGVRLSEALEHFSRYIVGSLASTGLIEGSREFLDRCVGRYDLQICSSAPDYEISEILAHLGMLGYFSNICGFPTNKNEFLIDCLKSADRVIFIGDSISDLMAAQNTEVEFIGFRFQVRRQDIKIVDNYSKLSEVIYEIEMRNP